jgi:hypothetical protein
MSDQTIKQQAQKIKEKTHTHAVRRGKLTQKNSYKAEISLNARACKYSGEENKR